MKLKRKTLTCSENGAQTTQDLQSEVKAPCIFRHEQD